MSQPNQHVDEQGYSPTTVKIRELKKLKQYLLDTDRTIKDFVNEAIDEKMGREQRQNGQEGPQPLWRMRFDDP